MTQWYVKELSQLTQISVQTLHHYDRIGLLKPSVRLANGYRLYSEKDLLKLQQIIALKFFGFELAQVKMLLDPQVDMIEHFSVQSQLLEKKAKTLFEASEALKNIIDDCRRYDKSIPWETIIKLIEVYRMTQQLEKTWVGKVLNQEELKQYASFEQSLKNRFTAEEQKETENSWKELVAEVQANLHKDPKSDLGIRIGKRCMDWVNQLYGKQYTALRNAIWEKGFKGGHIGAEHHVSPEIVAWLDLATEAYYRDRTYRILGKVESHPQKTVLKEWEDLLMDMCGDEQALKDAFFREALKDEKISQAAKSWIKKTLRDSSQGK